MRPAARDEVDAILTARMYECRSTARTLLGDHYTDTMRFYREVITAEMKRRQCSILSAVIAIGVEIPESEDVPRMCLMAAAVEMIEQERT